MKTFDLSYNISIASLFSRGVSEEPTCNKKGGGTVCPRTQITNDRNLLGTNNEHLVYRIYPCIMHTFFPLKKLPKLRCILYTESFVLDSHPSLACEQIHKICPYTIICF